MSIRIRTLAVTTGWLAAGALAVGIAGVAIAGAGPHSAPSTALASASGQAASGQAASGQAASGQASSGRASSGRASSGLASSGLASGLPADGDSGTPATRDAGTPGQASADREDRDGKARRPRARAWLWRHLEHGQFVVRRQEGHQDFLVQRGAVTAVSQGSLSVRSRDGFTATWELAEDTRVRSGDDPAGISDIETGATVVVLGPGEGQSGQARLVRIRAS
jgi:hypothetical protein